MTNLPPVWLLDIDGVINAISRKPDRNVWPAHQWARTTANGGGTDWPILVATPVLDFLRRVHTERLAEIWWHTTWQNDAVNLAKALDLPHFPVRPCPEFGARKQALAGAAPISVCKTWWKLPAAELVVGIERRSLVWTDDDAKWELAGHGGAGALNKLAPTLVVSPQTHTGLTPKHLRQIEEFLTDCAKER